MIDLRVKIQALIDGGATEGEREAAREALRRYDERHAKPEETTVIKSESKITSSTIVYARPQVDPERWCNKIYEAPRDYARHESVSIRVDHKAEAVREASEMQARGYAIGDFGG